MDLSSPSKENLSFMIEKITEKLRMINSGAFGGDSFTSEQYTDVRDLYELVMSKTSFSPSEMEAIVSELGNLRKKSD